MIKKQRNFKINKDLDSTLKNISEAQGISVSQLIELACYSFLEGREPVREKEPLKSIRENRLTVYLRTDQDTYKELMKVVKEKNTTISQEINYRLNATLFDNSFSDIEMTALFKAMYDVNRLGNLLKLSLNNDLNTPELLIEIGTKIDGLYDYIDDIVSKSAKRKLKK